MTAFILRRLMQSIGVVFVIACAKVGPAAILRAMSGRRTVPIAMPITPIGN